MAVRGKDCVDGLVLTCRDFDAELVGVEDVRNVGLVQFLGRFYQAGTIGQELVGGPSADQVVRKAHQRTRLTGRCVSGSRWAGGSLMCPNFYSCALGGCG
jgi:hypothetical protein